MRTASQHTEPPRITWQPTPEELENSRLTNFLRWLSENKNIDVTTYREAWEWSVLDPSNFWGAVREYFDVVGDSFVGPALAVQTMPEASWFPHARLNYAENVLRYAANPRLAEAPAIIEISETNREKRISWCELESRVAALASAFRDFGIEPGDSVAAVLPNIPEAIVALLATAAVGAVWTISSPELSSRATLDRLTQMEPKLLIGTDQYRFGGKDVDCLDMLEELRSRLPSLLGSLLVSTTSTSVGVNAGIDRWIDFGSLTTRVAAPRYDRVSFDHPLWVLFTSGTTGLPKGIVHGHGGITLEALKSGALNHDIGPDDVYYVAANTSWMVWNVLLCNMACGATVVTYSGSPVYPTIDRQFEILSLTRATKFATGAAYLSRVQQHGTSPGDTWDLSALKQILSTGSPLPISTWEWVHECVKQRVHLGSSSGGTEICSAFIGLNPLEPVYLGELQGPALGAAVESWNTSGQRVVDQVGEMVISRPMPSMPVRLLDDENNSRYRSSYFEHFADVWTHGDWVTETPRGGFVVHGRSDATLNRSGVRFGSGDIYGALEDVPEIRDSLVVGVESGFGQYYMPLFVVLVDGLELDDQLRDRIRSSIRSNASARHLPDEIIEAPAVPVTYTGKKAEVPVKRILGMPQGAVSNVPGSSALANPESLDWYVQFARLRTSAQGTQGF